VVGAAVGAATFFFKAAAASFFKANEALLSTTN
jgi:hypothetical protein